MLHAFKPEVDCEVSTASQATEFLKALGKKLIGADELIQEPRARYKR
jgi:hypothetical protein